MENSNKTLSMAHAEALDARGIDPELAVRLGLWTKPGKGAGGDAVAFPFYREGEVVNNKYRTSIVMGGDKGKLWQDKGGRQIFWNEDALRDDTLMSQPVIITEGEFDAMAAIQAGLQRTVSVPAGAPDQSVPLEHEGTKYDFLNEARALLSIDRAPVIILAVDGDEKGAFLLHDLSVRLGRARCKFVTYPKRRDDPSRRCKDLNEVLVQYGEKGVQAVIDRAQWLRVEGVYKLGELPPVPPIVAYPVGHTRIDLKIRLGDFWVVTGIPSMGKTSFTNDLLFRLAWDHGINIAFGSFEQEPQRDHRRNLRTWFNRKLVIQQSDAEIARADAWVDERFSFIIPVEDEDATLDWLLDRMEVAVIQHGVKVIVIDPWNELDHCRSRDETLTEYTGRAIRMLKRFAKRFQVCVIVVAHPSKQQKDQDGNYKIPTLYDVSDSSHWYNKADVGIIVHREGEKSIIRIGKSRYHDDIGPTGDYAATFIPETRRYDIWQNDVDD